MTGKDLLNYSVALVLTLATIPLYRYIIGRGHAADATAPVQVTRVIEAPPVAMAQVRRAQLLDGEKCVGGLVILVNGNSYTQALESDGRPARCEGQFRVTAR